jgi:putative acetyltransferase
MPFKMTESTAVKIRSETPRDYAAIANLHARAFGGRGSEGAIVSLLRHRAGFDPDLSLVAELDGQIVGHVLFSPYTIRLLGEGANALNLAPIGVDPAYQRHGVGTALINTGHEIARGMGYSLCFLLGHPEYYPRFGYRTGVYGASSIAVTAAGLPDLQTRLPVESDIPALCDLWLREEGSVDFAIMPGEALLDWISPNPAIESRVYLREGMVVGYARVHGDEVRMFLARDAEAARAMAAQLAGDAGAITLPLHPYSVSAAVFGKPECKAWDAGMACSLVPGAFDEFYAQLQAGKRLPGRPLWPVAFDVG